MRLVLIGGFQGWLAGRFGSFLGSLGSCCGFCFTLAAAHFTRVVRCTAIWQHYGGGFFHNGWCFNRCRFGDHGCCNHFWLCFNRRFRLLNDWRSFYNHRRGFYCWRYHWGFYSCWLSGRGFFDNRLWCNFYHRLCSGFSDHHRLAHRLLNGRGNGHFLGLGDDFGHFDPLNRRGGFRGFSNSGFSIGAFGLLVGLRFGIGADVAAGNSGGYG